MTATVGVQSGSCDRASCSLSYRVTGTGPPILFIQGFGVQGDGWAPQERAAADRDALASRIGTLFGHDIGEQPPIVMRQLSALGAYDSTARLGELAGIPCLVVSAFYDPIAPPRSGRAIAAGIPGARYVEISDASHGVPIQQADRINALLRQHLDEAETAHTTSSETRR